MICDLTAASVCLRSPGHVWRQKPAPHGRRLLTPKPGQAVKHAARPRPRSRGRARWSPVAVEDDEVGAQPRCEHAALALLAAGVRRAARVGDEPVVERHRLVGLEVAAAAACGARTPRVMHHSGGTGAHGSSLDPARVTPASAGPRTRASGGGRSRTRPRWCRRARRTRAAPRRRHRGRPGAVHWSGLVTPACSIRNRWSRPGYARAIVVAGVEHGVDADVAHRVDGDAEPAVDGRAARAPSRSPKRMPNRTGLPWIDASTAMATPPSANSFIAPTRHHSSPSPVGGPSSRAAVIVDEQRARVGHREHRDRERAGRGPCARYTASASGGHAASCTHVRPSASSTRARAAMCSAHRSGSA